MMYKASTMNMQQFKNHNSVTLMLWNEPIELSLDFVKTTSLLYYFTQGGDISHIIQREVVEESDKEFIRDLLIFISNCYEYKITDCISSLCFDLLFYDAGSLKFNTKSHRFMQEIFQTILNIDLFFRLYDELFGDEYNVLFENHEDKVRFVYIINTWFSERLNHLRMNLSMNNPSLSAILKYTQKITQSLNEFIEDDIASSHTRQQQLPLSLITYDSPTSQLTRTNYERMRKKYN